MQESTTTEDSTTQQTAGQSTQHQQSDQQSGQTTYASPEQSRSEYASSEYTSPEYSGNDFFRREDFRRDRSRYGQFRPGPFRQGSFRRGDFRQDGRRYGNAMQRYERDYFSSPNIGTTERQLSVAVGGLLVLHALINRSRRSLVTGPLGMALIVHGQSERSPIYEALEINTAERQQQDWLQPRGWPRAGRRQRRRPDRREQAPGNTIEIERAVTVDKPAEELYNFWRKLENLPSFMHHLKEVEQTDETHSHWVAKLAGGLTVEWDAEIVEDVSNERIVWRSLPDSQVNQVGTVVFKPATGQRGTVVYVDIKYTPPGGIVGETFARLLNGVTAQQVKEDIRRFKSLMEAGEIPTVEGQPSGRSG